MYMKNENLQAYKVIPISKLPINIILLLRIESYLKILKRLLETVATDYN